VDPSDVGDVTLELLGELLRHSDILPAEHRST
jgi:hypothetical protein